MKSKTIFLLSAVIVCILLSNEKAAADTIFMPGNKATAKACINGNCTGGENARGDLIWNINLNKKKYNPGEEIVVSSYAEYSKDWNDEAIIGANVKGTIDDTTKTLGTISKYSKPNSSGLVSFGNTFWNSQKEPGKYEALFIGSVSSQTKESFYEEDNASARTKTKIGDISKSININYEVVAGADGKCGLDNGNYFSSAPNKNLCSNGRASLVDGADSLTWNWSCFGIDGGNDASCSANKSCFVEKWDPDPSTKCEGETFTQTSNCQTTRSAVGTKYCPTPISYDKYYCVMENSIDCNKVEHCGETNQKKASCLALNSNTGRTDSLPLSSCKAAGVSCSDQTEICKACSNNSKRGIFREVAP